MERSLREAEGIVRKAEGSPREAEGTEKKASGTPGHGTPFDGDAAFSAERAPLSWGTASRGVRHHRRRKDRAASR